ncbi:CAZyme family GH72 [Penicillium roqueforti]|uniref:1,3-beta-glucanosyltransferase n=1 Tax=Penicillium roqueforti (strain FM164) TaxID=1365484 RepID=W6Q3M2_PENRF|nr:CAZyme family GH72 [Penicillium roqueforti]CDM28734.1 Glucanosyltransferase [Penicillium roqueforti FM164]KAI2750872.1 CAZyme family GH72 [Penicillium roqueforti]KAI2774934.1 CAZyme family GH72 [Penicillium roqueforti]KAI3083566.1 CAZyme family GH72 [Penicillium roqueforti]
MSLPVVSVAGNGLLSKGKRFQIKGVVYGQRSSRSTPIDVLAGSRASQCAIDGPMIKALGANTISVGYIDATQSHDKCMQVFEDNGIYVLANMASQRDWSLMNMTGMDVSSNIANSTWQMNVFKQYAAVLDSMAGYNNLLGLLVGDEIISGYTSVDLAPYLKAAARDMKAYTAARQYRPISIGYATSAEYTYMQALGEYLVCGGNSDNAVDFYSVNDYQWCGNSSIKEYGYDTLTSKVEGLSVPTFFSEDGCDEVSPRLFGDQPAIFGSNMSSIWSGAIIDEWRQATGNYGLVSYTTSGVSTPTTLADYNALKSQWSSISTNTEPPSTLSTPSCPASINSYWPIDPSAALPTIAGLDFATIKAAGATDTTDSTRTSISTSTSTSSSHSTESSLSSGAKAGIGIGVALGVVLSISFLFLLFWHRRKIRQGSKLPLMTQTPELAAGSLNRIAPPAELAHTTPLGELAQTNSLNELPGSSPRPQELDTGVVHKADKPKPIIK